mgnify:CR=1 FL=1
MFTEEEMAVVASYILHTLYENERSDYGVVKHVTDCILEAEITMRKT